jgi:hypothetical protein
MDFTPEEYELVKRISKSVSWKWSAVEEDDLRGQLYLWLCQNYRYVLEYRKLKKGEGKLHIALTREAQRYAVELQEARNGAFLDHDSLYPVSEVKRILPLIFSPINPQSVAVNPRTGQPLEKFDNDAYETAFAEILDVRKAFEQLPQEFRMIIEFRYIDEMLFKEIGKLMGMSDTGARKKHDRSLEMISSSLNG